MNAPAISALISCTVADRIAVVRSAMREIRLQLLRWRMWPPARVRRPRVMGVMPDGAGKKTVLAA